jgi:nucleoside-diphosphate-sugar epimerase
MKSFKRFIFWGYGKQVGDFIHVIDIVDASIINDICVPVNLGTGLATSFN